MDALDTSQIPFRTELTVTAEYRKRLLRARYRQLLDRPVLLVVWLLLVGVAVALTVNGAIHGDPSSVVIVIPVVVVVVVVLVVFPLIATAQLPIGTEIRAGFGATAYRVAAQGRSITTAYADIRRVRVRGDMVWFWFRARRPIAVLGRELVLDDDLELVRAAVDAA